MVEAETSLFYDIYYRRCLEVATMVYFTRLSVHERVVCSYKGIQLNNSLSNFVKTDWNCIDCDHFKRLAEPSEFYSSERIENGRDL
jgi:hypothetical protein